MSTFSLLRSRAIISLADLTGSPKVTGFAKGETSPAPLPMSPKNPILVLFLVNTV